MENTELLHKYELMIIVDAKLTEDDKEAVRKQVTEVIGKEGGKVINSHVWLEKHKMTFEIKKRREGTYYAINFEAEAQVIERIKAALRLNEKVLRFLITRV